MCRGSPCTGISTPAMAPTSRDQAPAAHTTVSVAIVPARGAHAGDAAARVLDPGRRAALQTRAPRATAAAA